jgi:glycosyltransferase involved in cell wall biosynthesis
MYPPHHYGGYEIVWRAAVDHLRARGHEVRVLTTDTRTATTEADSPDVHRELIWPLRDARFEPVSRRDKVALARRNHRTLERHLDDLRPDVVAWWSMGGLSLTLLESVRRRGLPAVAFVHDDWLDYAPRVDGWLHMFRGRRSRLAPLGERLTGVPARVDFDAAARYLFVSERTRRHALARVDLGRTGVAHSGINEEFLDPEPPAEWRWQLLYVGRLDPRKGVHTAVEALSRLPVEAELELIGGWDSREEDRLRTLAQDAGTGSRIRFSGHRGRSEIVAAYARADVVVFPVLWEEPWGLVPLEAMGKGRPVVATGRGGSAEYLRDRENCLLFEAGDPDALANAIRRLAGDPELRESLRRGGLETAPRYTEEALNEAVEAALLDATGARPKAALA